MGILANQSFPKLKALDDDRSGQNQECWEVSLGKGKNMLGLLGQEGRKCWEMVRDGEKRMGKGGKREEEKEKGGGGGEGEGEGLGRGRRRRRRMEEGEGGEGRIGDMTI